MFKRYFTQLVTTMMVLTILIGGQTNVTPTLDTIESPLGVVCDGPVGSGGGC